MSIIIAAPLRKAFAAAKFDGIIAGLVPFADNEMVKPSFIKMNKATAAASMGGKADPVSFVTGLLFNIAAFSQGQKVESLCNGLPPVAAFAIQRACGLVKLGGGIDAKTLKLATMAALGAVAALPTKAEQAAEQAKIAADIGGGLVIDSTCKAIPEQAAAAPCDDEDQAAAAAKAAALVAKAAAAHDALWAAYGDNLAAARKAEQAAAPSFVELFGKLAASNAEQAAAMVATMAENCGLVVISKEDAALLAAAKVEQAAKAAKAAKAAAAKAKKAA